MLSTIRRVALLLLCAVPAWADSQNFTALSTDGTIYGTNGVYATARSTATAADTGFNNISVGQDQQFFSAYDVYRGYIEFDVSAIPAGSVITGVTLTGTVGTASVLSSSSAFNVQIRDYVWTTPLGTSLGADFTGCMGQPLDAGASAGILCAATACNVAGTQATATLSTASVMGGPGSKAKFCLTSSRDASSTAPGPPNTGEYINWASQESGNPFVLSVTWTSGVPTNTPTSTVTHTPATTPTRRPTNTPVGGGTPVPNCPYVAP